MSIAILPIDQEGAITIVGGNDGRKPSVVFAPPRLHKVSWLKGGCCGSTDSQCAVAAAGLRGDPVGAQVAKLGALVEVTSWARGVLQEAVWVLLLLLLLKLL
eukprot:CAMPEP_0206508998 /NCGR_PEP_ID=MMETSP0324_2-20121206/58661_1 /ASSEMBLY_ACC=CAM_ASM_000836 /TAXON_ID=2866 /ORGANISM="Crypthecodinium cohnii, Strain Seligo" /LENGTH=101 /DNA_ID=CAMNT_0053999959 /DNA_START=249 /DNA_END=552 /DNA_ORIENTATION=+